MDLYGSFKEREYKVEAYLPSSDNDHLEWIIRAYKKNKLVREIKVPIIHRPIFGPDIEDVATLEEKTEEFINSLP